MKNFVKVIVVFSAMVICSCYGTKQAEKGFDKALKNHPEVVVKKFYEAFPVSEIKADTSIRTDTLLEFIDCPEDPGPEYVRDTLIMGEMRTVTVKVPGTVETKTVTITKTVKDSSQLWKLNSEILILNGIVKKQTEKIEADKITIKKKSDKIYNKNIELWIHRIMWLLLFLFLAYRFGRNASKIKFK